MTRWIDPSLMEIPYLDPVTGKMIFPKLELWRLAIHSCTYTQTHLDYIADSFVCIKERIPKSPRI